MQDCRYKGLLYREWGNDDAVATIVRAAILSLPERPAALRLPATEQYTRLPTLIGTLWLLTALGNNIHWLNRW